MTTTILRTFIIALLLGCGGPRIADPIDSGPSPDCIYDDDCASNQQCINAMCVDNPPEPEILVVAFATPINQSAFDSEETVSFIGTVAVSDGDFDDLLVTINSSIDGDLSSTFSPTTGIVFAAAQLSVGNHVMTLTATRGQASASQEVNITICGFSMDEDFNDLLDPSVWKIYGDAQQNSEGWLEMTNNQQFAYGKIFNIDHIIKPNNLHARFKIYTGPSDAGADGFSFYIVSANTVEELETVLDCSGGIGCFLSNALSTCSLTDFTGIDTFAVEFDTFGNGVDCGTPANASVDPTCLDHVAVLVNGSAKPFLWEPEDFGEEETPFWAAVDNIEDSMWHDVEITLRNTHAIVILDGQTIIDADVPEFQFKGGYLGFTGGSGAASNFHRFDDLQVKETCTYTGP